MASLKEKGFSSTTLRREKIFGEKTMSDFRNCAEVPYKSINRLCELLECQPGDIIEYVPDGEAVDDQKAPTEDVGA